MIYLIIFGHWVADFIAQTDKMAQNKSKSWYWLSVHIFWYWIVIFWIMLAALFSKIVPMDGRVVLKWTLVNAAIHFLVDAVTSRMTSKLYAKGDIHNFFVVVGADQAIHMATLIYTAKLWLGLDVY